MAVPSAGNQSDWSKWAILQAHTVNRRTQGRGILILILTAATAAASHYRALALIRHRCCPVYRRLPCKSAQRALCSNGWSIVVENDVVLFLLLPLFGRGDHNNNRPLLVVVVVLLLFRAESVKRVDETDQE